MSRSLLVIKDLECSESNGKVRYSFSILSENFQDILWYDVIGLKLKQPLDVSYNCALVGLLIPAMYEGLDIDVKGPVSRRLLSFLSSDLQDVLLKYEPSWSKVNIHCNDIVEDVNVRTGRVGTGFSAGVDSFATIALYDFKKDRALSLSDLFTFDVGAMGPFDNESCERAKHSLRFGKYIKRTDRFAESNGLGSTGVSSNLDKFFLSKSIGFQKTHTLRNVSAALVCESFLDYYLYSSAVAIENVKVAPGDDMAYMDPVILPMLSTEKISFISSGETLSRYEKTKLVSIISEAQMNLDVCVNPNRESFEFINCSRCWKCARTLLSLDSLGKLEKFEEVFDLDYYHKNKFYSNRMVLIKSLQGSSVDTEVVKESMNSGVFDRYASSWLSAISSVLLFKLKWLVKCYIPESFLLKLKRG